ncbi:MAG TPA: hypothetical protein VK936_04780, partial [Longimicrobiales bacterium]|nr:hypothetical protein [Longimicrobiales bacterium]
LASSWTTNETGSYELQTRYVAAGSPDAMLVDDAAEMQFLKAERPPDRINASLRPGATLRKP